MLVPSKRITPSALQEPSAPLGASQIFWAGPPETSIFLSFPSAKNPRKRLSGDQKGRVVPSVPASGCAEKAFNALIQIRVFPEASVALKARYRPSGEIRGVSIETTSEGVATPNRTLRGRAGARRTNPTARTAAAGFVRRAPAQASFSRFFRRATTGAGRPACEPPSAIHWSCSRTSCAVWNRSSGSLARQVLTTREKAGGVMGATSEIAGGSSRRIDPISDAWLFPVKALRP